MQTIISQYGQPAFAGMLDGVGVPHMVRSYAAEGDVAIAAPVQLGTDPEKQVETAAAGANVIGFSLHDYARTQDANGLVQYADTETVSVLTAGRLWVNTADDVVAGATANLVIATGKLTDAAVGAGIEAFTKLNVTFVTGTSGAGVAIVEIK